MSLDKKVSFDKKMSSDKMMRLDKLLAHVTGLSRKQVKTLLKSGKVTLNQCSVKDPALKVSPSDTLLCEDKVLAYPQKKYFMMNKPEGYVCATIDAGHDTVLDLIDEPHKEKLQIAGRLDLDTTGLVLLTDDGQWNHQITSPSKHCYKTYAVELALPLAESAQERFAQGILLEGEVKPTKAAQLELLTPQQIIVKISEGRYHQVKRMFAALGNRVTALHRQAIGPLELDLGLQPGEYRPLSPHEINSIK